MFGIAMFLMKDWRNTPGTAEVLPFLDKVSKFKASLLLLVLPRELRLNIFLNNSTSPPMALWLAATVPRRRLERSCPAKSHSWVELSYASNDSGPGDGDQSLFLSQKCVQEAHGL
jgi:hypothetical protein